MVNRCLMKKERRACLNYLSFILSQVSGASQVVLVVKNLLANAEDIRDVDLIPGAGRSPAGGHGYPLEYTCLENPMDRGAWKTAIGLQRVDHDLAHKPSLSSSSCDPMLFLLLCCCILIFYFYETALTLPLLRFTDSCFKFVVSWENRHFWWLTQPSQFLWTLAANSSYNLFQQYMSLNQWTPPPLRGLLHLVTCSQRLKLMGAKQGELLHLKVSSYAV